MVINIRFIRKKDLLKRIETLEEEVKILKENIDENIDLNKKQLKAREESKDIINEWLNGEKKKE